MLYFLFDVTVEVENHFIKTINHYEIVRAYVGDIDNDSFDKEVDSIADELIEAELDQFIYGENPIASATVGCYAITEEVFLNRIAGNI